MLILQASFGLIEGTIEQETFEVTNVIFTESPLNNVLCGGSGEVWAVGDNGLVMHFQNTWATQYLNKEAFFMRVKAVGDDVWLIGGVRSRKQIQPEGLLLRSRNRQDWRDETPPSRGAFSDMYLTGGEGWLVGAGGSIFHTSDEGHTWKPVQSPTDSDLLSIFFINRSQGWISGSRLTILALGAN